MGVDPFGSQGGLLLFKETLFQAVLKDLVKLNISSCVPLERNLEKDMEFG